MSSETDSKVKHLSSASPDRCPSKRARRETPEERRERLENEQLQIAIKQSLEENGVLDKDDLAYPCSGGHIDPKPDSTSADSNSSEWKKDEVTALIATYQSQRCLYDQNDPAFPDAEAKESSYLIIQTLLKHIRFNRTVPEIKKQIRCLLRQYIAEKIVKDNAISAGQVTEHSYEPQMWCFGLLQFLDEHIVKTVIHPEVKQEEPEILEVNGGLKTIECDNVKIKKKKVDSRTISTGTGSMKISDIASTTSFHNNQRDDIFGEYIASEMRVLKNNAPLYLKTKQAIINVLTRASFEILKTD